MSVISNFECCEHKKGPVGPQTGPLAFNCLRIPFFYSFIKPIHHSYYYHVQYHYHCAKNNVSVKFQ